MTPRNPQVSAIGGQTLFINQIVQQGLPIATNGQTIQYNSTTGEWETVSGGSTAGAIGYSSNPVLNPFYPVGIPLNGNAVDTVRYSGISTDYLTHLTDGAPQLGVYDSLLDQVVLSVTSVSSTSGQAAAVSKTEDGETATILSGASGYQMTAIANNGTRIVVGYSSYDSEGSQNANIFGYSDDNLATIAFVVGFLGDSGYSITSIASNGGNIWIATLGGTILRSTDNGVTWAQITPTNCTGANKVIWDGTQFVLAGVATGTVTYLGTSVAGATWAQVDTTAHDGTSASLNDITKVGTTYIITGTNLLVSAVEKDAVCLKGTVLTSLTASTIVDAAGNPLSSYGLAATTGMVVAGIGNLGVPYLSTDNGATWAIATTYPAGGLNSISFHDGSSRFVGVLSSGANGLSYSPDGDEWTDTTVDDLAFYATEPSANLWMKGE